MLADQLRSQINAGVLQPGDRLPTFAEMCAQHKVTPTTISRVYSILQQEKLITCTRGRGSFVAVPDLVKTTGVIGVMGMGQMRHPYAARLMRGIAETTAKLNREILLIDGPAARHFGRIDGIILHGSAVPKVLSRLPQHLPAVVVMASLPNVICVTGDDRAGIKMLMEHLFSLKHRRIAALLDPLSSQRISAYQDALFATGTKPEPRWLRSVQIDEKYGKSYAEIGYESMQRWLQEDWDDLGCTALLTQNDDTAHGVIKALRKAGKRVPEEVSVTGFDGTEVGNYSRPFLTTVQLPLEEIGSTAANILQRQISGEKVHTTTKILPVTLRASDSTLLYH